MRYSETTRYAQCPFFQSSNKVTVQCEGITNDSIVLIRFLSPDKRTEFRKRYCNSRYFECPMYKLVEKKYDDK